jgi:hypothetical protein
VQNDARVTVWVQYLLHLDCLNDTTVCFVPAAGEEMQFVFTYSKYLGLNPESDVTFNVDNSYGETVYKEQLYIPWADPEDPDIFYSMALSWDGRCNAGENDGHLADPELSTYEAYISLNIIAADDGKNMTSNFEPLDLAPEIDSIIIAQEHWYPPPCQPPACPAIYLNSIVVGKVDDVDPETNQRYYLHGASQLPAEKNHRWDGMHYLFGDGVQPLYDFFEDLESGNFDDFQQRRWKTTEWGNLRYEWWNINDVREGTSGGEVNYSNKRDTTIKWGDNWEVCIEAPHDEEDRKRLLLFNIIEHTKNGFAVQACTSAIDEDAHKVIFGPIEGPAGRDNIYWSSTHIGVPYGKGPGIKNAYINIDCSGFCIATQIQENNGPLLSDGYQIDLDNTNADMLVRDVKGVGGYVYHGDLGHIHTTIEADAAESQAGDMMGLDTNPPPWDHIANVAAISVNQNNEITELLIYEAAGHAAGMPPPQDLIRKVNGINYYLNFGYHFKFARWDYD